ncbi:hypothetical protein [Pararhizobium gei]|uniref:hypothetical protein n=1 Tax=Pararhizobium gei TaxID=1395951 RepID=UPI0023DAEC7D|nr:hypothetical protein [Rhizobium gei]
MTEPPLPAGDYAAHFDHRVHDDHIERPGNLFRMMSPEQQQALVDNTAPRRCESGHPHQGTTYLQLHGGRSAIRCEFRGRREPCRVASGGMKD